MQNVDVCRRESGKLWTRKPNPGSDGLVLSVTHSALSALPLGSRNVRFMHIALDSTGDRFIACDCQGNVFLFDIHGNKFSLVQKSGSPCSVLAFALHRRSEFLVGMADRSLKCFDTETKELVAVMRGHESTIHAISVHASGRYAMTTSTDTAQLWDLDSFQRKRKLTVKEDVPIVRVFFLPVSNIIMMCFKDDSIFAWDSETMQSLYHLHVPTPGEKSPGFKSFAASRDGRILVAGGRSRFLHVWSLESKTLLRIIELPQKVTSVNQLEFLPESFDAGSNQVLGALCQDGIVRFISIVTFTQLFDLGRLDDRVCSFLVAPTGRHIVAVMDSGNINVYSGPALARELNKPPAPLVKLLKSNKMADGSTATSTVLDATGAVKSLSLPHNRTRSSAGNPPAELSGARLMSILKGYGEYPAKYRMFIWRTVLQLPENHAAYAALVEKGTHPAYERLHERYPIKSHKLQRVLQRVLSALAHWSPIFGETDYLPMLAFPFVKLFQNNQLVCFEIVATVLVSWCQHWFEYFPNPPINVLGLVENVLAYHDKELLQHFVRRRVTSQTYAWPVLETLFSEVLTRDEWLRLVDNMFSNHPAFLIACVVAYCIVGRAALLRCTEVDDFEFYFHHRNAMSVSQLVSEAYHVMEATPADIHPQNVLEDFTPLTRGQYPIFNKYPKFIVDYQVQERERIRQEEVEYMRQKSLASDLRVELQKRQQEEEGWYRQQQLLLEAEQARRNIIADEEQKLADQRARLLAMTREAKMKELELLDAARRKFMTFTQQQKEAELARLDDEIRRKAELREAETRAAIEEVEIKNMELQMQKKLFEQELFREYSDLTHRHNAEIEARRKQHEAQTSSVHGAADSDGAARDRATRTAVQRSLAHAEQLHNDAELRSRVDELQKLEEQEVERAQAQVSRLQEENRHLEQNIQRMIRDIETRRMSEAQTTYDGLTAPPHRMPANAASLLTSRYTDAISRSAVGPGQRLQPESDTSCREDDTSGVPRYDDDEISEQDVLASLNRDRATFDEREHRMMRDIRQLRQRLAIDSRANKPCPPRVA